MKAQNIRLLDVFVLGPFMIWAGYELGKKKEFAGIVLSASGIATIVYNWNNYKAINNET